MADLGEREQYRQRRRKPRPAREPTETQIHKDVSDAYDLVPELGNGYRWYDWPYRFLYWFGTGWRRRLYPRAFGTRVWRGLSWLIPFNEHDRNKVWSRENWLRNIFVAEDEHVNVAGIWLVELFPPTELPSLEAALDRNGWNKKPLTMPLDGNNREKLSKARAASGLMWWRLADLMDWDSNWLSGGDSIRTRLPDEFTMIELRAVQIGPSLTAVIAEFHLTDEAATALDGEWHKTHEPILMRGKPRWRSLNRKEAAYWRVQSKRRQLHSAAREWLTDKLPGFFTSNGEQLPLLDLMLFDKIDPTTAPPANLSREKAVAREDAYRALGISTHEYYQATSPDLPKLVLSPLDGRMHGALGEAPTWTLWGRRDAVVKALGEGGLAGYGGTDTNRAIASRLVDNMFNLFVMLAVSEFLHVTGKKYAVLRDRASTRHGKFRPRALRELRKSFLTLSLNLSSVQPDVSDFWSRNWRWDGDAQFTYNVAPRYKAMDRKAGRKIDDPIDYNADLKERQEKEFARLIAADRDYRDILSTVASLGASADSFKLGRIALWVAIVSLVVAVATVLLSELSGNSVLGWLWTLLRNWAGWA
ncbi:hypothetical protein [Humibacter sp.]|uniref:hypothetical protein n=1 Tax=Humibacter sp. TaxID=1940291 RepID=UPI002BF8C6BC|nr:hypothetical protein [Humibacter sp.]HVX08065.1 hypothetical protein [Humibacter sp.]